MTESLFREFSTSNSSTTSSLHGVRPCRNLFSRKRQRREVSLTGIRTQAVLQSERRRPDNSVHADAPVSRPDSRRQLSAATATADSYVPLDEAQDVIRDVVDATSPTPPVLLRFCKSAQQELRYINYAVNGTILGMSMLLAASHLVHQDSAAAMPSFIGALRELAIQGSQYYEYIVDVHPIATKAVVSGTVYALGDFTAQAYEGRSWKHFDAFRILRSGLIGFLAHGPLSHFFYEKLDRFFIVSKYFDGGDAWFTPIPKILVDQTLFAASWNTLYYILLGALKFESPAVISKTIQTSWWEMLKAGWRIWPIIHIVTYTAISCQDRLLWVDMCELAWVTVLSFYGQQRRERDGAVACSLPGTVGEGGIFTEDILRGMTVESQIIFQSADGAPVVRRLDEVFVEAALLEANFGSCLDDSASLNNPVPLQPVPVDHRSKSEKQSSNQDP